MSKKAKIILIVTVVVVALVILFFPKGSASNREAMLQLQSSPEQVSISINGESRGSLRTGEQLAVGAEEPLDVQVSYEGFETYSTTLTIEAGQVRTLHVALLPQTDEAWAMIGEQEQLKNQQKVTEEYWNDAAEAYENNPILEDLPHHGRAFEVYQGLATDSAKEFGIYLYLYKGNEVQGRKEFNAWMTRQGYDPQSYDVVEKIKDQALPVQLPEEPTMQKLSEIRPSAIEVQKATVSKDSKAGDIARQFALETTTWDAGEDRHHTDSLMRTQALLEKGLDMEEGMRLTTSPSWREAAQTKSKSYPWIKKYTETTSNGGVTKSTVQVCWAWIRDHRAPRIDGPRTYTLEVNRKQKITSYTYSDPDPFVENKNTICQPDDAR
ncbi:PEGA domain-containing protein [Glutamicibacter sp. NPDC090743]|uniref:PEGA domain-containing protein n=1 Tax=Glutamicibacter sp. NPDC090743 TaxID=3364001 RepID=UPI00382D24CC